MDSDRPRSWHVAARLEELRGEERANGIRVLAVAVFYAIEVIDYRGLSLGPLAMPRVEGVDTAFHAMATALAVAWIAVAAAVVVAIKSRIFPPALKYLTTGADLVLLSAALTLADGPRSPVLMAYFLVIALAGLRLSRRLVWFATSGAVLGYAAVLFDVWRRRPELTVPPHWTVTTVAALVLCGLVVSQILAGVRRAAQAYAELERDPAPRDEAERA